MARSLNVQPKSKHQRGILYARDSNWGYQTRSRRQAGSCERDLRIAWIDYETHLEKDIVGWRPRRRRRGRARWESGGGRLGRRRRSWWGRAPGSACWPPPWTRRRRRRSPGCTSPPWLRWWDLAHGRRSCRRVMSRCSRRGRRTPVVFWARWRVCALASVRTKGLWAPLDIFHWAHGPNGLYIFNTTFLPGSGKSTSHANHANAWHFRCTSVDQSITGTAETITAVNIT